MGQGIPDEQPDVFIEDLPSAPPGGKVPGDAQPSADEEEDDDQ